MRGCTTACLFFRPSRQGRGSQVVRQRSAKPLFASSILARASKFSSYITEFTVVLDIPLICLFVAQWGTIGHNRAGKRTKSGLHRLTLSLCGFFTLSCGFVSRHKGSLVGQHCLPLVFRSRVYIPLDDSDGAVTEDGRQRSQINTRLGKSCGKGTSDVIIGIGGRVASPPLPHHRTSGSAYGGSIG
jgi:hypothetical protein